MFIRRYRKYDIRLFVYNNELMTPEGLGNYAFGYTGSAMGFTPDMLYLGGGVVNAKWKLWKLLTKYYGESKEDHDAIERGIKFYEATH